MKLIVFSVIAEGCILKFCFYIDMNEFFENQSFYQQSILHMFELLGCFNTNFTKSGQFSIKLCEKVSMVTCTFHSFDDKLLDEIIPVQSLIVLHTTICP